MLLERFGKQCWMKPMFLNNLKNIYKRNMICHSFTSCCALLDQIINYGLKETSRVKPWANSLVVVKPCPSRSWGREKNSVAEFFFDYDYNSVCTLPAIHYLRLVIMKSERSGLCPIASLLNNTCNIYVYARKTKYFQKCKHGELFSATKWGSFVLLTDRPFRFHYCQPYLQ